MFFFASLPGRMIGGKFSADNGDLSYSRSLYSSLLFVYFIHLCLSFQRLLYFYTNSTLKMKLPDTENNYLKIKQISWITYYWEITIDNKRYIPFQTFLDACVQTTHLFSMLLFLHIKRIFYNSYKKLETTFIQREEDKN